MLNWINANYRKHILTLEDPIEFTFTEDKCLINQREIGIDVRDFELGMKHAVREDPDVMLVGEMRDRETFHDGHSSGRNGPPGVRHDPRLDALPRRSAAFSTCFRKTCTRPCAARSPST